jgi:ABC-type antimicrobial peptide transport system permease subunit
MTLGAGRSSVLRLLLRDTMRPVAIGMVIGAVFAAIFSQAMTKVLLGVSPFDPIAFIGVAAFLSTVALVASYVPARHATRIDPVLALRYD